MAPADFAAFALEDGDLLDVLPAAKAAQLPNSWGNIWVPIAPGHSIRLPPVWKLFQFQGYQIPEHLIVLTGAGPETFDEIGREHVQRFRRHLGIEAGMHVLDVGCGIGRDAFQLFEVLGPDGTYVGIDVTQDSSAWCEANITPKHPSFTFHHFDAVNELYNPFGTRKTMDFSLPVPDASMDRILLSSVFTHLLEDEIMHYLRKFHRVLAPGGLNYASLFHLIPEALEAARTKHNTSWLPKFDLPLGDGVFANNADFPRGAAGFTDTAARRMIATSGLELDRPFLKGWWSGLHGEDADDGQDVMMLRRP